MIKEKSRPRAELNSRDIPSVPKETAEKGMSRGNMDLYWIKEV